MPSQPRLPSSELKNKALQALLLRVRRSLARRSFLHFCLFVWPGFVVADHHRYIARALDRMAAGELLRLMISLPPRHTKSLMCSELFPAYYLGLYPDREIIHASYSAALSNSFSYKVRDMLRNNEAYRRVFPHVALDPDRQRVDDWRLVTGGSFKSIGVQGGITGRGAHLMIIDDPHKEGDEQSPATLQAVVDWYNSAARTRLYPDAAVLFPMTRWHPNDLAGRLLRAADLDPEADQWEHIKLAALALAGDPLGRKPGAALWPAFYGRKTLLSIKALSERYFEALYQQNPALDESPMFAVADFVRGTGGRGRRFWTVDLAITEKIRSDYNVFLHWAWNGRRLALLGGYRFRAQWPGAKSQLKILIRKHRGEIFYFPKAFLELVAVQTLRQELPACVSQIKGVFVPGDKVSAAAYLSDLGKNGRVVVARNAVGDAFVREAVAFPDSCEHDDLVDASSVATHALGLNKPYSVLVARLGGGRVAKNKDGAAQLGFGG